MTKPLVSVIIPVWNCEKWLKTVIDSVVKQDYQQWELLVIDNGSTDASFRLIQQYNEPRIRSFQQPHSGVSSARNLGLENAQGTFICFLDCDDQLPPTSLGTRVEHFEKHPTLGFVDGTVEVWNADFSAQNHSYIPSFTGQPFDELRTLSGTCFYGITWMIRREVIGSIRFKPNMTHSEDLAFFATVADSKWHYDFVQTAVYQVRKREDSAMSNLDGLASGYRLLFDHFTTLRPKETGWKNTFRGKVRRILVRSYLKRFQLSAAFKSWRRWR